jgi:hypothetical protein
MATAAINQRPSNFRPMRSLRPPEPPLDVEFPTNAEFSSSSAPS